MIQEFEKWKKFDWEKKLTEFKSLRDMLDEAGFDPDTFTISVNAKLK